MTKPHLVYSFQNVFTRSIYNTNIRFAFSRSYCLHRLFNFLKNTKKKKPKTEEGEKPFAILTSSDFGWGPICRNCRMDLSDPVLLVLNQFSNKTVQEYRNTRW